MRGLVSPGRSISTRLTLMVAAVLVLAVLAVSAVAVREQQHQLRRALQTKASSLVQFMAQVSPLPVLSLNFVEMGNEVRKVVLTDDEAVYAAILNEQRIPLASFFNPASPLVTPEVRQLVDAKDPMTAMDRLWATDRVLEVSAPITAGDRRIGTAVLGLTLETMHHAAAVQIGQVGLVAAAILLASLLLLRFVLRRTLEPVQALTAAVAEISAGHLDVAVSGTERTDELGVLSRGVASMAGQLRGLVAGLEQRVADRTAALQTANEELESFAYSVSHDLRAPLRHVDGFVALLRKHLGEPLDERTRYCMDAISQSARRMGDLIDNLLSFSRMGRSHMSRARVDLGPLLAEVLEELGPEASGREVRWQIAELPTVSGDRAMLRAVLSNLVANALKFTRTRQPAEIEVGCRTDGPGEIVVYVRDNGVGFDPAYAQKLFRVFQRLHRAEEFEGNGIGLANVRRIISRHGGRTWAEGALEQGATVYFSLPKASVAP